MKYLHFETILFTVAISHIECTRWFGRKRGSIINASGGSANNDIKEQEDSQALQASAMHSFTGIEGIDQNVDIQSKKPNDVAQSEKVMMPVRKVSKQKMQTEKVNKVAKEDDLVDGKSKYH